MVTKCSNCKGEINTDWKVCPFCGTKVSETLNKQVAALEMLMKRFGSELNNSPDGIRKTQDYIEKVMDYIESYQGLEKALMEKIEAIKYSPKVIKDKTWNIQVTTLIVAMTILARGGDRSDPQKKYIPIPPDGCIAIFYKYKAFTECHEELINNYSILQSQRLRKPEDAYTLFGTPLVKVSEAIVAIYDELEKVNSMLAQFSTDHRREYV